MTNLSLFQIISMGVPFLLYSTGSLFNSLAYSRILDVSEPKTLLFLLPIYMGLAGGGRIIMKGENISKNSMAFFESGKKQTVQRFAANHVVATVLSAVAIYLCGPGLCQLCFSISPLFSALAQYLYLGKKASILQIIGILIIVTGLAARALFDNNGAANEPITYQVALGVVFAILSSLLYSCGNIVGQKILQGSKNNPSQPTPGTFLYMTGYYGFVFSLLLVIVWTLPQWKAFNLSMNVLLSDAAIRAVLLVFTCQASINIGFVGIVTKYGAVFQSVLSGLNTITVLTFFHVFYCSEQSKENCLTPVSTASAVAVTIGVLLYGLAPKATPVNIEKKEN